MFTESASFDDAKIACESKGNNAHLAFPETQKEFLHMNGKEVV